MAKVKAPLMSFDARGQIAKSLVYLGWKGLKTVRQYVIPANPQSDDQQQQRGYFTLAITEWHTAGYTSDDIKAWKLLALSLKKALSGFNIFVSLMVKTLVAVVTWDSIFDVDEGTPDASGTVITATTGSGVTCTVHYGTRITAMFNEETLASTLTALEITLTGLTASTKYYFYITDDTDPKSARTGVYSFETIAA